MWYKEALALRGPLAVFAIVVAALGALNAWGAGDTGSIYVSQAIDIAVVAASILALVIGTRLGRERGHLAHSALVRPIPRVAYAATVFAVDFIALIAAYAIALVEFAGAYQVAHGAPPFDLSGVSPLTAAVLPVCTILAWYGLTSACCVVSRGAIAAALLIGPTCIALWCGAAIYTWQAAPLFRVICIINPLMYFTTAVAHIERYAHPHTMGGSTNDFFDTLSLGMDATILCILGLAYLAVSAIAWKRAEV